MRPTQILSREHQVILNFLDTFGRLVENALRSGSLPAADFDAALTFLEHFADAYHHDKEELCLFAALRKVGMHRGSRPVAMLSQEHERGRELVTAMREHAGRAGAGDRLALQALMHLSREFVDLQMDHIEKEDRILFPLADELLDEAAQAALLEGFEELEGNATRSESALIVIFEDLRSRYGPWDETRSSPALGSDPA